MVFYIVSLGVPLLIFALLPRFLNAKTQWLWLLGAACCLFFISWYLPSPSIDGKQTQFVTHFIGGGVFTGLLWLYIKLVKNWRTKWWLEAGSLYALVSALGVANELFELFLFKLGEMPFGIADTSWDLLANTLGALLVFMAYIVVKGYAKNASWD